MKSKKKNKKKNEKKPRRNIKIKKKMGAMKASERLTCCSLWVFHVEKRTVIFLLYFQSFINNVYLPI